MSKIDSVQNFFTRGMSLKNIFSCHYPFRSAQTLRIFGKGEKSEMYKIFQSNLSTKVPLARVADEITHPIDSS